MLLDVLSNFKSQIWFKSPIQFVVYLLSLELWYSKCGLHTNEIFALQQQKKL